MSSFRCFAVVPAAGKSRRMGEHKLFLPWRGTTIIEQVLTAWQDSGVDAVVMVVRAGDRQLQDVGRRMGVEVAVPEMDPPDMRSSVRFGLSFLEASYKPDANDCWMLAPADVPQLSSAMIRLVRQAHEPVGPAIVVPTWAGRRGHPTLFPWRLAREIENLTDKEGINTLVQRHTVREIAMSGAGFLRDVDTPGEYAALRNECGSVE
jgi:molybdenum cofactor cytidylyltransferase